MMKLIIMHFSPTSVTPSLSRLHILLDTLSLNTTHILNFEQDSHPHTAGKIRKKII